MYVSVYVKFVVFTDYESCTRPISTNPGSMENKLSLTEYTEESPLERRTRICAVSWRFVSIEVVDSRSRRNISDVKKWKWQFLKLLYVLDFAKYLKSCFFSVVGMVEINRRRTSHKYIPGSDFNRNTIVINIYDTIIPLVPLLVFYTQ